MLEHEPDPEQALTSASSLERRAFVRLASDLVSTCRTSGPGRDVSWPGKVRDISLGGVGLIMQHRFRAGTALDVELRDPTGHLLRTVWVRVAHATATIVDGRTCWLLGCRFDQPLTEDELQALV
jgi:hypothetical protein